jgi:hypothetical protein
VPFNEPTLPRDMGVGPDNAKWLADNGFNTIRLGLYYARVEPQPGTFDDAYLTDFLRVQDELADQGLFTPPSAAPLRPAAAHGQPARDRPGPPGRPCALALGVLPGWFASAGGGGASACAAVDAS